MAKIWILILIQFFSLLDLISAYYKEWQVQCVFNPTNLSDFVITESHTFNKIQYLHFNSTVGRYVGYTEFGIQVAEEWNKKLYIKEALLMNANSFCSHYGGNIISEIRNNPVELQVKVKSVKQGDGSHPAMLLCSAYNFYPKYIKVTWLRDGREIKGGVTSVEEMADGDWYYQVHSHLEYMPKSGEEISCMVEHASLNKPMIYKYDPSASGPDRSKIALGASGLVLGIVLSAAGFIYYKKKFILNLDLIQQGEAQTDDL